jgi:hypothetical protein
MVIPTITPTSATSYARQTVTGLTSLAAMKAALVPGAPLPASMMTGRPSNYVPREFLNLYIQFEIQDAAIYRV